MKRPRVENSIQGISTPQGGRRGHYGAEVPRENGSHRGGWWVGFKDRLGPLKQKPENWSVAAMPTHVNSWGISPIWGDLGTSMGKYLRIQRTNDAGVLAGFFASSPGSSSS